jgi:transposase InsO family protein
LIACVLQNRPKVPLIPLPVVSGPFDRVAVDVLGPFPPTYKSNKYILIFSDYLTRWPDAIPVEKADAETTAKLFVEEIVCRYGAPRMLLSDNGKNFRSNLLKEISKLVNTRKTFTTAYHHETDGLVERFNGTLTAMFSMYVSGHQRDWDTYIPYVMFAYRTALHESTQETPFFLMHGRDPILPVEAVMCPPTISYFSSENYKDELTTRLHEAFTLVKENMQRTQHKQKEHYDIKSESVDYEIGDKVWIYNPSSKPRLSGKLLHNWHEPFKIIDKLSDVTFKLQTCDDRKYEQTVHVNRIKRFVNPEEREEREEPDDPKPVGDSDNIVKILDMMRSRNDSKRLEKHYFVQFGSGETKWVRENEINNYEIIRDFNVSNKGK